MDILNCVLPDLPSPIVQLDYLPQEQLGVSEEDRDAIFDLYCITGSGTRIIVEMQNSRQQKFLDREITGLTLEELSTLDNECVRPGP